MSINCTPSSIVRISKVFCLFSVLLASSYLVNLGFAQPIHPFIQLKQPSNVSTNALDKLQESDGPAIGLYLSRDASRLDPEHKDVLDTSIRQWEYLLIGLQLPYVLLSDSLFDQNINNSLDILIVPAPESLPDTSLRIIQGFVNQGGGVIASGYSGRTTKKGRGVEHVKELAGIKELLPMGVRSGKVRQKFMGTHPMGRNLPLGFELDLISRQTAFVAQVGDGEQVGHTMVSGEPQPYSCVVTNSYGDGKVVWMGFSPQDVPPNDTQQRSYQELVIDALVYVSGSAYASIRRWPNGYESAASFVQLPSSGYQPFSFRTSTDLLLNTFEAHNTDATFFVVLQHAQDHPDLLNRMVQQGELGLVSDSPKLSQA